MVLVYRVYLSNLPVFLASGRTTSTEKRLYTNHISKVRVDWQVITMGTGDDLGKSLWNAIECGQLESVKSVIESGADVNFCMVKSKCVIFDQL